MVGKGGLEPPQDAMPTGLQPVPFAARMHFPGKPARGGGRAAGCSMLAMSENVETKSAEAPSGWSAGGGLVERATGEVVYVPESSGEPENRLDQLR